MENTGSVADDSCVHEMGTGGHYSVATGTIEKAVLRANTT